MSGKEDKGVVTPSIHGAVQGGVLGLGIGVIIFGGVGVVFEGFRGLVQLGWIGMLVGGVPGLWLGGVMAACAKCARRPGVGFTRVLRTVGGGAWAGGFWAAVGYMAVLLFYDWDHPPRDWEILLILVAFSGVFIGVFLALAICLILRPDPAVGPGKGPIIR